MGYNKIIVVLTRTLDYRKSKPNPLLAKLWYRKYPKFAEAVNNRYTMYNQQVESVIEQAEKGEIFVIRPSVNLNVKRVEKDPNKLQAMYNLGVSDMQREWKNLQAFLEK
jgi:hypothetical protein